MDFGKNSKRRGTIIFNQVFYLFFSNDYVQTVVSLIGTIAIGLMTAFQYFGVWFWLTIVIYCISVVLTAWANRYLREKMNETRLLKQALLGIDVVLRAWGVRMQTCAKKLKNLSLSTDKLAIDKTLSETDFQAAAFTVCEKLCDSLSKYCDDDSVYITLYQKYEENGIFKCKMIAFSGNHEPSSYGAIYTIPEYDEGLRGKVEYHTLMFAENKTDISTFCNHEEITKAFVLHEASRSREEKIQQYICVPIAPAKLGVTFLLQIDTDVPDLFGKDHETVDRFAKIAIYPFAQFLHMIYEQARTIRQLSK